MKIFIIFFLLFQLLYSEKLEDSSYYDAFGLVFSNKEQVSYIARRGNSHVGDNGHIHVWKMDLTSDNHPTLETDFILIDSEFDDRNIAGGISNNNTAIIFYSEYDYINNLFKSIKRIRCLNFNLKNCSTPLIVYENNKTRFSPYGNMITLPENKLMQTFYEHTDGLKWRLFVMFSNDDGLTWKDEKTIYESIKDFTGECSSTYANNKIVIISRNNNGPLLQFISKDFGKTFQKEKYLTYSYFSDNRGLDHSPILYKYNKKSLLVYADRKNKKIKIIEDINSRNSHPISIYDANYQRIRNFGYPSVFSYKNKFYCLFYTEDENDNDTDIYVVKFIDIIDNQNLNYQEKGSCFTSSLKGYSNSISHFCNKDTNVIYTFNLKNGLKYKIDFYSVIHENRTKKLMVSLDNGYSIQNHYINLSNGIDGFKELGYVQIKDKPLKITISSKDGKIFSADAIKLTRIGN